MKIIFLDFDGVLNSRRWIEEHHHLFPDDHIFMHENVDEQAVARVQKIIDATGAKIVISSTWRLLNSLEKLKKLLAAHGLSGEVIGVTPRGNRGERGDEIQTWVDENGPIESFVILDDDSDMAHLMDKLVQTTFDLGLQDEHVDAAIQMLGVKP